jgi:hypothetical protein
VWWYSWHLSTRHKRSQQVWFQICVQITCILKDTSYNILNIVTNVFNNVFARKSEIELQDINAVNKFKFKLACKYIIEDTCYTMFNKTWQNGRPPWSKVAISVWERWTVLSEVAVERWCEAFKGDAKQATDTLKDRHLQSPLHLEAFLTRAKVGLQTTKGTKWFFSTLMSANPLSVF